MGLVCISVKLFYTVAIIIYHLPCFRNLLLFGISLPFAVVRYILFFLGCLDLLLSFNVTVSSFTIVSGTSDVGGGPGGMMISC